MPILEHSRHEAFAQARARGVRQLDAYEDAGFASDRSHASRLARDEAVALRIAELRAERAAEADLNPRAMLATLIRIAKACEELGTPAALKEARLTVVEARRIGVEFTNERNCDRYD